MNAMPLSARSQKLLRLAHEEADKAGSLLVASEHLLTGAFVFGGVFEVRA